MSNFVANIENLLIANGIPMIQRRSGQFPFHTTIGQVQDSFPKEVAVAAINKAIPVWNTIPIVVDSFTMLIPPFEFISN